MVPNGLMTPLQLSSEVPNTPYVDLNLLIQFFADSLLYHHSTIVEVFISGNKKMVRTISSLTAEAHIVCYVICIKTYLVYRCLLVLCHRLHNNNPKCIPITFTTFFIVNYWYISQKFVDELVHSP